MPAAWHAPCASWCTHRVLDTPLSGVRALGRGLRVIGTPLLPGRIPVVVASLVNGAASMANARSGLMRVCAALLTSEQRTLLFPEQLAALEPLIEDRLALLGNTVAESVENILSEDRTASARARGLPQGLTPPRTIPPSTLGPRRGLTMTWSAAPPC